jgi:hypothetical protein
MGFVNCDLLAVCITYQRSEDHLVKKKTTRRHASLFKWHARSIFAASESSNNSRGCVMCPGKLFDT